MLRLVGTNGIRSTANEGPSNFLLEWADIRPRTDIVGDFELDGSIDQEMIYLCKQYIGQHRIDYHGTSIGEGAYTGKWSCYGIPGGNWFIGIIRSADTTEALTHDVQEIRN